MTARVLYSFVMDRGAAFSYQAWHLAHSLVYFCGAEPQDIHVQCTPRSDQGARTLLERAGFQTHTLTPFGDGKYCNKLAQIENLPLHSADIAVLLDTDTIAVSDLRPWISSHAIRAKIVDAANPPIECLQEIADNAGLNPGDVCATDMGAGDTFIGNCNGGMYAIPTQHCSLLSGDWRRWALWLLDNPDPLQRAGKQIHVDQVSFWMALRSSGLPFELAASNTNYFTHFAADHLHFQHDRDIALLHYHDQLNVVGKIEPLANLTPPAVAAIERANDQIGRRFNNRLFWNFRYERHPERGSGVGSRGDNLAYKRTLQRAEGIEQAVSVLDIGCGDLEVVKNLRLANYTGIDESPFALDQARFAMPAGNFKLGLSPDAPSADFVLCLEVLIHQSNLSDYKRVIAYAAERTERTLLVSGYSANTEAIAQNSMVFFHEPLERSLREIGRFSSIREIGRHTDVVIYRCDT
jgi:hypothetical protein